MNATMISIPSATMPQVKGTATGVANAGLSSQAAGFGDMLQVLLIALVPAALVESMAAAPQPEDQMAGATSPMPKTDETTAGDIGGSSRDLGLLSHGWNTKLVPSAGNSTLNLIAATGWPAVSRFSGDTAASVLAAESRQVAAAPVTDVKVVPVGHADGPHVTTAPTGNSLLGAVVSHVTKAEPASVIQAGSNEPVKAIWKAEQASTAESAVVGTARVTRAASAAPEPSVQAGRPEQVSGNPTRVDAALSVLWKSTVVAGFDKAGSPAPVTPRPGGLGESSATSADSTSANDRVAPAAPSHNSDGTSPKEGSGYPQTDRGQGEAVRPASSDGTAGKDTSLIAIVRPEALAGDRIRPSGVQPGPNQGGMPAQAVYEAIADRAQVARLRGENLARFELATSDGNTIRVRIAVNDNVVSARIAVTSATMRDVLVQHTPELSQRLQAGGLVPEAIQVSLIGDRGGGSERHDRRQERGRSNGLREIDVANPTLIETDDIGFEKWA